MSTNIPFDPVTMWKEAYDKTESAWSDLIQEIIGQDDFSEQMGGSLNVYLQQREVINKMTERYLKEVNLPSRQELASLASLIINLEEKIDQLDDRLSHLQASLLNKNDK